MKNSQLKKIVWVALTLALFGVMSAAFAFKLFGGDTYELTRLSYFNRCILLIEENYFEPERIKPEEMFYQALNYIESSQPKVMVERRDEKNEIVVSVDGEKMEVSLDDVKSIWRVSFKLLSVLSFIEKHIPTLKEEDKKDIEFAAINGMLSTLDPHSVFLPPQVNEQVRMSTEGKFGGLGIVITLEEGELTVISPIPGTPAAKVGIQAWDKIVTIDEESTINMPLDEAVSKLRGKPGSDVTIDVMRKGWSAPRSFTITRAIINIKSVLSERLKGGNKEPEIGYILIKNFHSDTAKDLKRHIAEFISGKDPVKGIILDLRNNPGGLLDAAIKVSDVFLEEGTIVSTVGMSSRLEEEQKAQKSEDDIKAPLVVLVNSGSASASEIVAGALKNNDRALILGERTFGKGSVQVLYRFDDLRWANSKPGEETSLKLTVAQYLTPGGISIQTSGISPDIELSSATIAKDYIELEPAIHTSREKDLKKHFERLNLPKVALETLKPQDSITYLYRPPEEEDKKLRRQKEALGEDIEIDFPVILAKKILMNATSANRKEMLERSKEIIARARMEQAEEIKKELEKRGINWTKLPVPKDKPLAEVKFEIVDETPPLEGGDEAKLLLAVKNVGGGGFSRLRAVTESELAAFNEKEFILGSIPAGGTAKSEIKVSFPYLSHTRTDEISFKFFEDNGNAPPRFIASATVRSPASPRYMVKYKFDDTAPGANGDGKLDIGETARITVDVENVGEGTSPSLVAALKNESGGKLFIKTGRLVLNELKPSQKARGEFTFKVKKDFENGSARFQLSVFDVKTRHYVSEKFEIPIGGGGNGELVPPVIAVKNDFSDKILDVAGVTIEGEVADDTGVKEVFITLTNDKVSSDKIYMKDLPSPAKRVGFSAEIPLAEGANLVTIKALKGEEFYSYKSLIISRRKVKGTENKHLSERNDIE
ncbi:MAG: hypothetical protein Kow0090_18590 [Myxococcota bacterium]